MNFFSECIVTELNDIRIKVGNENDEVETYLAIEDHDSLVIYVDKYK